MFKKDACVTVVRVYQWCMYPNSAFLPMVHVLQVVQTQRALGDAFAEMSQKSPELQEEFAYNCETQRVISKNGETLIGECMCSCQVCLMCLCQ